MAISADQVPYAWSMAQTTGAKYQILSDSDRKVIKAYGILNPSENNGIAHPSVFLVDKEGRVRYAYVGKNAGDRPPDEALLQEVKKLSGVR